MTSSTLPSVGFLNGYTSVKEGNSGLTSVPLKITLSAPSAVPVTVTYTTDSDMNGVASATRNVDYVAATRNVVFAPGETVKTVNVSVIGDTLYEGNERFYVEILGASGANVADVTFDDTPTSLASVTILNDDASGAVTVGLTSSFVQIDEGNDGTRPITFTAQLSAPSATAVVVYYSTDGDYTATYSATRDVDYKATTGFVTFAPGEVNKTFTVDIIGDTTYEPTESFPLALTSASGAVLVPAGGDGVRYQSATAVIVNDDAFQAAGNHAPAGSLVVAGTAAAGSVVNATSSLADADGLGALAYQWQASADGATWTAIAGAKGSALTVAPAQAGQQLRVAVSYTDLKGSAETVYSAALGTAAADRLAGTPLHDSIVAGAGNDIIRASAGGDSIDGGDGRDTVVYAAAAAGFTVARTGVLASVTALAGGTVDALANVERLMFADADLAFDAAPAQAFRLYQAAFNRAPDLAGLGYWIAQMDQGAGLQALADAFVTSNEFKLAYGSNPGNAAVVDTLYHNILHRSGDPAGAAYWINLLDTKAATVANVLAGFSDSAENQAALVGVTSNGVAFIHYG